MGAITPDKKLYDQVTVAFFQSRGWQAFAIKKTGRYADVLGVKGNSLAIIEVKSIKETSAVKSYDDSANLSPALNARIGPFLKTIRQKVFAFFPRGSSLEALYAATIAAQIYRYIHEFEEKAADYEKFTGSIGIQSVRFTKIPFLVVPSEYESQAMTATKALKSNGYISSVSSTTDGKITVIGFTFLV